ncbi:MAG: hypothetical protein MJY63_04005 [Paludibacteraceae bacterium]|nr:hypothetical protein [Paludibacteraceae bacterium]
MKNLFTPNRICMAVLSSMLGFSAFAADCVVNYTNFDTTKETTIDSVKQGGLLRAKIQTNGNSSFDSLLTNKRYTSVVGDPRTLSPYFMETESQNMIVTAGTITGNPVFMTYKVANLVPGSDVTLTFDAYNLLSIEKMEDYLIELNKDNSDDLIRELKFGNSIFSMMPSNGSLQKGTGRIMGNRASLSVSTAMSQGVMPSGDKISTPTNFDYGTKAIMSLASKADANGEICFYFYSQFEAPIAIDNIKVEGEAQLVIECLKRMPVCPSSPVIFEITNTLDSVSYSWSNGVETSNKKIFTTSFDDVNETYTVKCTIEGSGCQATSSIDVQTKECCVSADGKPLDIIDVFFDDFGEFSNDGTEYTYISNGKKTTIPTTGIYGPGDRKRCVNTLQEGASVPYINPSSKKGTLNDAWAITNINPYNPGVLGDASGDPMGGMLIVDLSGSDLNGRPLKDLVIYRHEANGNLKGKEITFGCKLGTINNIPPVGDLKVVLKNNDGITLFEEGVTLLGTSEWISVEGSFVSESDTLVFEIINDAESYVMAQGDFAIDDVFISYCDDQTEEGLPSNPTGVDEVVNSSTVVNTEYFNLAGKKINSNEKGIMIERQYLEDGSIINHKIIKE